MRLGSADRSSTFSQVFEDHQFGKTPIGRPADERIGERSVEFVDSGIRINITCCLPKDASGWRCWVTAEAARRRSGQMRRTRAPRLVYVASGSIDAWAGPRAEKAAWDAAHDLYRAYRHEDRMGYHCHEGPHQLRADDWEKFMDFADAHWRVRVTGREGLVK